LSPLSESRDPTVMNVFRQTIQYKLIQCNTIKHSRTVVDYRIESGARSFIRWPHFKCIRYSLSLFQTRSGCCLRTDGDYVYDSAPPTGWFRKGFFMFLFVTMYVLPSAIIIYTCIRIVFALGKPVCSGLERSSAVYRMENNKRKVNTSWCCCFKQDTCSNEDEVCPMPVHKYEAQ